MKVNFKYSPLDSYEIYNDVKPCKVLKITGFLSGYFSQLKNMSNIDPLILSVIKNSVMDVYNYMIFIESINDCKSGENVITYLADKTKARISYIDSFKLDTDEYRVTYKDDYFGVITDKNTESAIILSNKEQLLTEFSELI